MHKAVQDLDIVAQYLDRQVVSPPLHLLISIVNAVVESRSANGRDVTEQDLRGSDAGRSGSGINRILAHQSAVRRGVHIEASPPSWRRAMLLSKLIGGGT